MRSLYYIPGRFNIKLTFDNIPANATDMAFFISSTVKCMLSYLMIRSRNMLLELSAFRVVVNIMNGVMSKGLLLQKISDFDHGNMPLGQLQVVGRDRYGFDAAAFAKISTNGISIRWFQCAL